MCGLSQDAETRSSRGKWGGKPSCSVAPCGPWNLSTPPRAGLSLWLLSLSKSWHVQELTVSCWSPHPLRWRFCCSVLDLCSCSSIGFCCLLLGPLHTTARVTL